MRFNHCDPMCEVCPLRELGPEVQGASTTLIRKSFSYFHWDQIVDKMAIQYRDNPNAGLKVMLEGLSDGSEAIAETARAIGMILTDNCPLERE